MYQLPPASVHLGAEMVPSCGLANAAPRCAVQEAVCMRRAALLDCFDGMIAACSNAWAQLSTEIAIEVGPDLLVHLCLCTFVLPSVQAHSLLSCPCCHSSFPASGGSKPRAWNRSPHQLSHTALHRSWSSTGATSARRSSSASRSCTSSPSSSASRGSAAPRRRTSGATPPPSR